MTPTIDDPTFGPLEYDEGSGCWRGDVQFEPADEEVGIEIKTDGPEPSDVHRQFFSELGRRYASLAPALGRELLRLYSPHLGEQEGVKPQSPEEMMSLTRLDWIEMVSTSAARLGYGFRPEVGWDDAMFTVLVEHWTPRGERLED